MHMHQGEYGEKELRPGRARHSGSEEREAGAGRQLHVRRVCAVDQPPPRSVAGRRLYQFVVQAGGQAIFARAGSRAARADSDSDSVAHRSVRTERPSAAFVFLRRFETAHACRPAGRAAAGSGSGSGGAIDAFLLELYRFFFSRMNNE